MHSTRCAYIKISNGEKNPGVLTLFCMLRFNLGERKLKRKQRNTPEVVMKMYSKQCEIVIEVFLHKS